ncbi:ABC-three component system protein [Parasedimentitalea maritima]|uniref:ABC-three component systems C-terminal domain-containing protein n=1 Tax=Parasedimentitalea maritima TaxID=2578117 RepID=A0A6A4RG14_9RHOB|nr:ABC-three component system protein [Zongyanglinia marina]KAE9627949.1 hypothetical protein GP644_17820 [Zongyanglinia marina]
MPFNEDRLILNLTDSELEDLIKKWLARVKGDYVDFERPTSSADMGRDAVGFLSKNRYDGEWHNYQCKQLKAALGKGEFAVELGKIFHYHCAGYFTLPTSYIFVAPNSGVRTVKNLIDQPSKIGPYLIEHWDEYCLEKISTTPSPLTKNIRDAIESYPFEKVELWKASEIVERPHMRAVMSEIMDIDPGEAPTIADEDVPEEVQDFERPYIGQLVDVFGEHRGTPFDNLAEVVGDAAFGQQITTARRRFLEHRAFKRFFRDNLLKKQIEQVDQDVLDGVGDHYLLMSAGPLYDRMIKVMSEASKTPISGPLGRHNRVTPSVKQGACHHFANTGKLPWK